MFKIFDQYLMRQLIITSAIVMGGLSMIIMLTQSLRLFELVLESNASASVFFTLMGLTLPRFIETVLPASALIAVLFVFNRLGQDSEMIVMRASGASPLRMARPVINMVLILTALLLALSLWIAPLSISQLQTLRKEVRSQYAHLLFREGVFNTVGNNLTAYIRARSPDGRLQGLIVHDTSNINETGVATTIIARSGQMLDDDEAQKIIVYDGSRQEKNIETNSYSRLNFKQYVLEIPNTADNITERWREPDERTFSELLNTQSSANKNVHGRTQFRAEIHRRLSTPFLMASFALIAAACLLLGNFTRSGQLPAIITGAGCAIMTQALYLTAYNLAKTSMAGCILLYIAAALPGLIALFCLTTPGQNALQALRQLLRKAHL